jgi:hypothetical protein
MKRNVTIAIHLVFLLLIRAPTYAQTGVGGTWRAEGVGQGFPWTVVLRQDGNSLRGMVSSCASNFSVYIDAGSVDGNTLTFRCTNPAGTRAIAFVGTIMGDQMTLAWTKEAQNGAPSTSPDDAVFGDAAPRRFTSRRIIDADLLARERELVTEVEQIRGLEFTGGVNLVSKDLKIDGKLFLSQKTVRIRAIIVAIRWGLGGDLYWDPQVRTVAEATDSAILQTWITTIRTNGNGVIVNNNAAVGGADGLLSMLQSLADVSGHPELAHAPLAFWGHSTAGPFGASFAALYPERTIAFVRYHSGPVPGGDLKVIGQIPALFFCGGQDPTLDPTKRRCSESASAVKALWASGRASGAPWTFATEPNATHGEAKDLVNANRLLLPWLTAVLRQRLSPDGVTLRPIDVETGWLGNNQTGEALPHSGFGGAVAEASWLPDERTAQGWRTVVGALK